MSFVSLPRRGSYFAFEGGLEYGPRGGSLAGTITPIGVMQREAKRFFSSATSDLGVHVPTVAVLLDFFSGWRRPCDGNPCVRPVAPFCFFPTLVSVAQRALGRCAPATRLHLNSDSLAPARRGIWWRAVIVSASHHVCRGNVRSLVHTTMPCYHALCQVPARRRRASTELGGRAVGPRRLCC